MNRNSNIETFRDELSTVSKEGKRKWLFPKKPKGKFYIARNYVSIFLLLILIITPFIKINDHPFMLFNILERKFVLFGIPFGPHDFYIFVIAMIAIIVFIILFTVVFGRIFCGWACPQTIFMEMVFRKIEYWIEGDFREQMKLKKAPWTWSKIFKKSFKHIFFYGISFFISNIFLAYIIGIDRLLKIISEPPSMHLKGFISIVLFSGVFYWIFSYFREQVCTMVCPYGRLQGVLLDQDSIVIAYDYKRGEPRGKIRKSQSKTDKGDCIDCHLCVDVCPTGIDIRNGIQLECVNCTACIDACDEVMEKINRPKKLIKYASLNGIENKAKFKLTPRMISYSVVLLLLIGVLGFLLSVRTDYDINVLRTPGLLFQEQGNGIVSNIYDINFVNKTYSDMNLNLRLLSPKGEIKMIGKPLNMHSQEIGESKFMVLIPEKELNALSTKIKLGIFKDNKLLKTIETSFLAPRKKNPGS